MDYEKVPLISAGGNSYDTSPNYGSINNEPTLYDGSYDTYYNLNLDYRDSFGATTEEIMEIRRIALYIKTSGGEEAPSSWYGYYRPNMRFYSRQTSEEMYADLGVNKYPPPIEVVDPGTQLSRILLDVSAGWIGKDFKVSNRNSSYTSSYIDFYGQRPIITEIELFREKQFYVEGVIARERQAVSTIVRVYNRATGAFVAEGLSDPITGAFKIHVLDSLIPYYVVALDTGEGCNFNAIIFDNLEF